MATCGNCGAETDANTTVDTQDGPVIVCGACLMSGPIPRPPLDRLAGEMEIVIASLHNLSSHIELLEQKIDALDGQVARDGADLSAQISETRAETRKALVAIEAELALLDRETVTPSATTTGITWLGVLVAVILGGLLVRGCL